MSKYINKILRHIPVIKRLIKVIEKFEEKEKLLTIEIDLLKKENKKIWDRYNELKEEDRKIWDRCNELKEGDRKIWDRCNELKEEDRKIWDRCNELKEEDRKIWDKHNSFKEEVKNRFEYNKNKRDELKEYLKKEIGYKFYKGLSTENYQNELCEWYKNKTGKVLDIDNPKTLNEKIQWLKLYDSTEIKGRFSDKYEVREFVKEKIGEEYLIPLLGVWESFEEISFEKLPHKFVLKATHGSGWNVVVKDKNKIDIEKIRDKFHRWLGKNYAFMHGLELHYKNIQPRIIAEQYMESDDNNLMDYKILCFNGEPKYIWVDTDRYIDHKRDIFDLNWRHENFIIGFPNSNKIIERPENLEEMISLARKLSSGFSFVRLDMYNINEKIYFGEMTFTSGSGIEKIQPEEYDIFLGQLIYLPTK